MNPSPAALEAIRSRVAALDGGWDALDDASLLTMLNAPSADNPSPRPDVPAPYTFDDLLAQLSPESTAKLVALPSLPAILDTINAGEMLAAQRWIALLVQGSVITGPEAMAVAGVMTATTPDPSWPAQISWAEANLGRAIDLDDLIQARPQ